MGMAASQARYLALTARKTNTEWEGQQINQARTALANQSANLFNRLLSMEVPNPPKQTDYTEVQYSYSDGDNEAVIEKWDKLSTNNDQYNYAVTHYYMADIFTGAIKQLQDPQVQFDDVLKKMQYDPATTTVEKEGTGIKVTYQINNYPYDEKYHEKITQDMIDSDEKLANEVKSFETAIGLAKSDGTLNTDAVYGYQDTSGTWHFFIANEYTKTTQATVDADEAKKQALTKFETENKLLNADGSLSYDGIYDYKGNDGTWHFTVDKNTTAQSFMRAYDNVDYSTVSNEPSYVGNSKLTELDKLIADKERGIDQVAELAQILRDCPNDNLKKYIHFDENGNLIYEGKGIYTFDLNGKTYYTTKDDLLYSVNSQTTDLNGIDTQGKLAYYNATYITKKIKETNNALLETDGNGRFTSVKFDNDSLTYTLNFEEVTDEAAYQDAMNKYLYDKAQYEKTIADINAKTSIIQKEDRTLELRLKQLDTEQNALATEMDAVKKVIKDNVEKTFKTFSD